MCKYRYLNPYVPVVQWMLHIFGRGSKKNTKVTTKAIDCSIWNQSGGGWPSTMVTKSGLRMLLCVQQWVAWMSTCHGCNNQVLQAGRVFAVENSNVKCCSSLKNLMTIIHQSFFKNISESTSYIPSWYIPSTWFYWTKGHHVKGHLPR